MFKVGDIVIGNLRMSRNHNRGRKASVVHVYQNIVDVLWEDGGSGTGISFEKFDPYSYPKPVQPVTTVSSIGAEALATLTERGKQYDASGKEAERSMSKIVAAFNIITGQDLTEVQGWEFMQVLKQVRGHQSKDVHRDSLIDGVCYSLLKAEAALNG